MNRRGARLALVVTGVLLATGLWLARYAPAWAAPGDGDGCPPCIVTAPADDESEDDRLPLVWQTALAWLVPVGLGMLACGAVPPARVAAVMRTGWLALAASAIGYWLCGFAFQFGGLGFVYDHPDLAGLVREWTWAPLDATWGTKWGVIGLAGYMLRGPASTPTALQLFFVQLPWLTTAVAVPLWSLQGRVGPVTLFLSSLLLAFVYALIGNWTWGGGWLANLGLNLGLGHGFVDVTGVGAVHLAGAASALAGMLAFGVRSYVRSPVEQLALPALANGGTAGATVRWTAEDEPYVPMPPLHLPVLATLGAWLATIGWLGWTLSTPLHVVGEVRLASTEMLIGLLLAAAGGAMVALAFGWLTTGEANALMTARGVLGALIAAGAGLPFLPLWAALVVGAGAGLLVPFVQYGVEHLLRFDDPTSALATHGVSALWGLLAVGLFAGGHAGEGWNRIGASTYLGVAGQGVTGYLAAPGYVSDWPGQFQAQVISATAIGVTAFFLPWLLFALVQGLTRAWQGEYTVRLPRRPRRRRGRPRRVGRRWPRIRFVRAKEREQEPEVASLDRAEEAPKPEPRPRVAALASAWRWVREKIGAMIARVQRLWRKGQEEALSEGEETPSEVDEDPSSEANKVSSEADEA